MGRSKFIVLDPQCERDKLHVRFDRLGITPPLPLRIMTMQFADRTTAKAYLSRECAADREALAVRYRKDAGTWAWMIGVRLQKHTTPALPCKQPERPYYAGQDI